MSFLNPVHGHCQQPPTAVELVKVKNIDQRGAVAEAADTALAGEHEMRAMRVLADLLLPLDGAPMIVAVRPPLI